MKKANEISSVTVPIDHYKLNDVITEEPVVFTISRENNHFKAIPQLSKEELVTTGLPKNWNLFISIIVLQLPTVWKKKH